MTLSPDQNIATHNFASFQNQHYKNLKADDAFELFAADLVLRQYGLNPADMRSGIVGATLDGGIDGFYIVLNESELIDSNSVRLTKRKNALSGLQSGVRLDVVIMQSKNSKKWDSEALGKLRDVLEMILDPKKTVADLRAFPLNDDVVENAVTLRKLTHHLITLVPSVHFRVEYVSLAKQADIDTYRETKRKHVETALKSRLPSKAVVAVRYVGDSEIVRLLGTSADFQSTLEFAKTPIREGKSLVGLVTIDDYLSFVHKDKTKNLRDEMFAFNVRDYAGPNIQVNSAIRSTLETDSDSSFWWLNNGITVISDDSSDPTETSWVLKNPMIVNGLQTSHVLHSVDLDNSITKKRRLQCLVVRVITEADSKVRESVINGTNNQTAVNSLQLHANDEIQIRIEHYLRAHGWYYERRRHQYRGASAPASQIRNMIELAQAVMAVHLLAPDTARARPNSLLSKPAGYSQVFSSAIHEEVYRKALGLVQAVEMFLAKPVAKSSFDDPTNSRFYLAAGYVISSLGLTSLINYSANVSHRQINTTPTDAELQALQTTLYRCVAKLDNGKIARDRIFKGADLKTSYFAELTKLNK